MWFKSMHIMVSVSAYSYKLYQRILLVCTSCGVLVVPCWSASDKKEVGARTIRKKINNQLPDFMVEFPVIEVQSEQYSINHKAIDWDAELNKVIGDDYDENVSPVRWAQPGTKAGMNKFNEWLNSSNFKLFADKRNDPTLSDVISNLSPWINYGHVSFQRLALTVRALKKYPNSIASYLEEGIVRRELSDNFVFYNPDYDNLDGAAGWARESLELHSSDKREYIYSREEFIKGKTHDDLWNAAQLQLVQEGKMHGFLRMYWAKKILEWTNSPAEALKIAQYLNDHYALDGNGEYSLLNARVHRFFLLNHFFVYGSKTLMVLLAWDGRSWGFMTWDGKSVISLGRYDS